MGPDTLLITTSITEQYNILGLPASHATGLFSIYVHRLNNIFSLYAFKMINVLNKYYHWRNLIE